MQTPSKPATPLCSDGAQLYRARPTRRRGRKSVKALTALAAAGFDASPAEMAVLAADGTVLAVNRAWRRFGESNGAGALCGPGAHYLRVTRRAADSGDETAAVVVAALEAVLGGDAPRARVDYPCHSPTEQRWFRLEAERLPGRHEVVLAHHDITAAVLATHQPDAQGAALTG